MLATTLTAVFAFAAAASALPGGSPLCTVDGAAAALESNMGTNQGKITCTFTPDKTSYTPGSTINIAYSCSEIESFQGFLAYASPLKETALRVGEFNLATGLKSNKAICGEAAEKDNSVVSHTAGASIPASGSLTYTASATDHGTLEFSFIVVTKVANGFRWGIFAKTVSVTSPGSSAAEGTSNYGTVAPADQYNCNCPAASTVSIIRKCTPKTTATTKVFITKTTTTTCTITSTTTEKSTTTVTETVSPSCGAVAGGEETPTTTGGYGYGYDNGNNGGSEATPTSNGYEYGSTPSPSSGGYGAYSVEDEEDDDDDDA